MSTPSTLSASKFATFAAPDPAANGALPEPRSKVWSAVTVASLSFSNTPLPLMPLVVFVI
jgi:hypothetical protein